MIARMGSGWQTVLADLSLILFMITAAAVNDAKHSPPPVPVATSVTPALGEPVAVWGSAPGAPPLRDWLAHSAADARLRLTIVAPPAAAQEALSLAASSGRPARVLIEPGMQGAPLATLTYDQAGLAQPLRVGGAKENLP